MDQPPGIGMAPDMVPALRMVKAQAAIVNTPAHDSEPRAAEHHRWNLVIGIG